jgi:nucleoside phosphorylase
MRGHEVNDFLIGLKLSDDGHPNAATVMDLLSAIAPKAGLFLGKCGGLKRRNQIGDLTVAADCPIRPTNPQSCALKRPCGALAVRRVNCA